MKLEEIGYIGQWLYDKNLNPTLEECLNDLYLMEDVPREFNKNARMKARKYIMVKFQLNKQSIEYLILCHDLGIDEE